MLTQQWQIGLLVGLFAVHLLVTYRLYRTRHERDAAAGQNAEAADSGADEREVAVVTCWSCGAENDLRYRYCRSCVEELPGATSFDHAGASPLRRMTR